MSFYKGKKVLVAGGAGFVGTNLVKRLVEQGANVIATIHKKQPQLPQGSVDYRSCDLATIDGCREALDGASDVFMVAACSSGAATMQNTPLAHLAPNITMNNNMLSAAHEAGVEKFCFISSNTVYPVTDKAVREEDALFEFFDKYHVVAWMKRFTEIMCEMYMQNSPTPMKVLVVRPGNLYGPYDKFTLAESKVIPALLRRAVEKIDPFVVWGDGKDIKDFLYIDDFIDALLTLYETDTTDLVFNIASGRPVTVRDVLKVILEQADYSHADVQYDSAMPTMIPRREISIARLQNTISWSPKTSMQTGIRTTIDWYKAYYESSTPEMKSG